MEAPFWNEGNEPSEGYREDHLDEGYQRISEFREKYLDEAFSQGVESLAEDELSSASQQSTLHTALQQKDKLDARASHLQKEVHKLKRMEECARAEVLRLERYNRTKEDSSIERVKRSSTLGQLRSNESQALEEKRRSVQALRQASSEGVRGSRERYLNEVRSTSSRMRKRSRRNECFLEQSKREKMENNWKKAEEARERQQQSLSLSRYQRQAMSVEKRHELEHHAQESIEGSIEHVSDQIQHLERERIRLMQKRDHMECERKRIQNVLQDQNVDISITSRKPSSNPASHWMFDNVDCHGTQFDVPASYAPGSKATQPNVDGNVISPKTELALVMNHHNATSPETATERSSITKAIDRAIKHQKKSSEESEEFIGELKSRPSSSRGSRSQSAERDRYRGSYLRSTRASETKKVEKRSSSAGPRSLDRFNRVLPSDSLSQRPLQKPRSKTPRSKTTGPAAVHALEAAAPTAAKQQKEATSLRRPIQQLPPHQHKATSRVQSTPEPASGAEESPLSTRMEKAWQVQSLEQSPIQPSAARGSQQPKPNICNPSPKSTPSPSPARTPRGGECSAWNGLRVRPPQRPESGQCSDAEQYVDVISSRAAQLEGDQSRTDRGRTPAVHTSLLEAALQRAAARPNSAPDIHSTSISNCSFTSALATERLTNQHKYMSNQMATVDMELVRHGKQVQPLEMSEPLMDKPRPPLGSANSADYSAWAMSMVQKFVRQAQHGTKETSSQDAPAGNMDMHPPFQGPPSVLKEIATLDQTLQSPSVTTVSSQVDGNEPQLTCLSPLAPISEGTGSATCLAMEAPKEMLQLPVSPRSREAAKNTRSSYQKYKMLREKFLRSPAEAVNETML